MTEPSFSQTTVLDLVPFGNSGQGTGFYALRLSPPQWTNWQAGQFVMLRQPGTDQTTVWARPFSICHGTKHGLTIFFQVKGRVTSSMALLKPGDILDMWGPLGNSLSVVPKKPTLLLAGGIGIAPFVGYADKHPTPWEITLEFGHRMPLGCYPFESLNGKVDARAHLESSAADRDAYIALMEQRIAQHASADGLVIACGPTPFLRTVQTFSQQYACKTQLCLETKMGCGIGACLGCVVKAAEHNTPLPERHFIQTCTCGPNFWADEITLQE